MDVQQELLTSGIVVGVDGSAPSEVALDWAARQADLERVPLILLHACAVPWQLGSPWFDNLGFDQAEVAREIQVESDRLLSAAANRIGPRHPGLEIRQVVRLKDPREALLETAHDARAIVVGSRGQGPIRNLLVGSVSITLAKHSSAPVVVVRGPQDPSHAKPVVVAVRNGDVNREAVRFAYRVASLRDLDLTVLHCFWDVVEVSEGSRDVADDEPGLDEQRGILTEAVEGMDVEFPNVSVQLQLTRGFVDRRLIMASESAELIVMGHQPKPLLNELFYGSVAPRVVEHAKCSVAVVPLGASGPFE